MPKVVADKTPTPPVSHETGVSSSSSSIPVAKVALQAQTNEGLLATAQVAMENYRQQNQKNVITVPRDQAIQPLITVQSAQKNLAEMRQKVQEAYQAQVAQDQQAKKHLAPDKQVLWNLYK
jgi:hypothetical protein